MSKNKLYYGDNLEVMRDHLKDESIDLIYLDPPFNSKRDYNLLFKTPTGHDSDAQVTAFVDSWHWGSQAEQEFSELLHQSNTRVASMINAFRSFLGENDVMAYLTMMANRLLELHRVLKPTGSLYLHCDPTASHYLKILMDAVFGAKNYRNEINWIRTNSHNFASRHYTKDSDIIFFYSKSDNYTWNPQYRAYSAEQLKRYKNEAGTNRLYKCENLTFTGQSADRQDEWRGTKPPANRVWGYSLDEREELWAKGRIKTRKDDCPRMDGLIVYLDETKGKPLSAVWDDIPRIANIDRERLGYPTQKPLALLDRIITVSSNQDDIILDPFCGCGTAVHAAQSLQRKWIGIDITHLSIALIEKRLTDSFPGIQFDVIGTPKDLAAAQDLASRNKYQFQYWACSLIKANPFQGGKKGADGGIDGMIFFQDDADQAKKIIVSVKGGGNVDVAMVRDLRATVERERASIGLFITLSPPTVPMITEAVSAGFYDSPISNELFPRLQILTIEGLLNGAEHARYPDLSQGGLTFKKAMNVKNSTPNLDLGLTEE